MAQGAKFPSAVIKSFSFEGQLAQDIALLLNISTAENSSRRLRLHSGIEWAVYLRDTPHPDASSSNIDRPQFNIIKYKSSSSQLEISGNWLDKMTGLPVSDLSRFYFMSSFIPESLPDSLEWSRLIKNLIPKNQIRDESQLVPQSIFRKVVSSPQGLFEIRVYRTVDYSNQQKTYGYQVSLGVEPSPSR